MRKINYAEPVYYVTLVGIDTEILVPSFGCLNSYTRFTNLVGKKHDHVYYDKCPDWREKLAHAMETMTIEQPPGDGDKNK
ncbi:hypothetical protein GL4_2496 [Methyloceanibacter caenitepidi]|uniref:Uncharacterized protein n=2 Tax=Methyloceanibacter caenitepidi TaxID=1384459 RepID=A0A0A8K4X3_9HYPH|nr:hypothetical protein GL4_2496 [Methyloceanibacter caenitepidi]